MYSRDVEKERDMGCVGIAKSEGYERIGKREEIESTCYTYTLRTFVVEFLAGALVDTHAIWIAGHWVRLVP